MAIISISRGCYSHGKLIAEKVAEALGYECVNREIVLEAVKYFNISEKSLLKCLEEAPGVLDKLTHGKEKYLSYFRAALLEHVKNDNVVYHGHAGHLLIPPVRHVLKVRINADMDLRVANLMESEKLSREKATQKLQHEDVKRYEWTKLLYNKDIRDSTLYDMVIHIGTQTVENACELICKAAQSPSYKTRPEDNKTVKDAAIRSHIHAALQTICNADVVSSNGNVRIVVTPAKIRMKDFGDLTVRKRINQEMREELSSQILHIAHTIPGVRYAVCDIKGHA